MPKAKTYLTPAEYAVLGLVRQKPAYGYELQRQLSARRGLGRVCPIEPGMIYAILKSLSGLELIDGAWDNSAYPPKAVYRATEQGEVAFSKWLRTPVARLREVRYAFLIKLYFALEEDSALVEELLKAQLAVTREYAAEIEDERIGLAEGNGVFDFIVLESKASAAQITLEWLERCRERLANRVPAPARTR